MSIKSAIIKAWLESAISQRRGQINSICLSESNYYGLKEEFYQMQRYPERAYHNGLAMTLPGNHDIVDVFFAPYFEGIGFFERVELEIKDNEKAE